MEDRRLTSKELALFWGVDGVVVMPGDPRDGQVVTINQVTIPRPGATKPFLIRPLMTRFQDVTPEVVMKLFYLDPSNLDAEDVTWFMDNQARITYTFTKTGHGYFYEKLVVDINRLNPDQFRFLTEKGVDLFGWIKLGLAIDMMDGPQASPGDPGSPIEQQKPDTSTQEEKTGTPDLGVRCWKCKKPLEPNGQGGFKIHDHSLKHSTL